MPFMTWRFQGDVQTLVEGRRGTGEVEWRIVAAEMFQIRDPTAVVRAVQWSDVVVFHRVINALPSSLFVLLFCHTENRQRTRAAPAPAWMIPEAGKVRFVGIQYLSDTGGAQPLPSIHRNRTGDSGDCYGAG